MRVLTVRQPWAWAIIHGGKTVENRTRNLAGNYRGPIAIHAGLMHDQEPGVWGEVLERATPPLDAVRLGGPLDVRGAILGVADLASVHHDSDHGRGYPCSPWAEPDAWHLVFENPRPITPIRAKGKLGLWRPDVELELRIDASLWIDEIRGVNP